MNPSKLSEMFNYYGFDAIISEAPQTRLWYSGVSTSDGWLIIERNQATLFVDGRYIEYAKNNAKNVNVELIKDNSFAEWLVRKNFKKIGIEENYLTVQNYERIKRILDLDDSAFTHISAHKMRIIKTPDEVAKVQKAVDIALEALEDLSLFIKEGITEKELKQKLEYIMVRKGAEKESFDSIVAFGAATAEPHHHSTDRVLEKGDMVTIDFGARYQGYCSDITRTFIFEDNRENPKFNEILAIVEEAARLGREAVRPGIKASDIDKVCRTYISSKGYSNFFLHSTGHGLGVDVHELPYVSTTSDIILEEGMIITVEPGIYIEGIGGARIEDDLLVTSNGAKVLSRK